MSSVVAHEGNGKEMAPARLKRGWFQQTWWLVVGLWAVGDGGYSGRPQ